MDPFVFIVIAGIVIVYIIYRVLRPTDDAAVMPFATTRTSDDSQVSHMYFTGYSGHAYPFAEITSDPNLPQIRATHTKIRGVSKRNEDGSDRQQIIRQWCHKGDALCFVREPNNPFDRNAIQVRRVVCSDVPDKPRMGEQIGYLSRSLAEEFAQRMDCDNLVLMAEILNFSGDGDGESVGVNVELNAYMPMPKDLPQQQRKTRTSRRSSKRASGEAATQVEEPIDVSHSARNGG
jgi:hypothetical protein